MKEIKAIETYYNGYRFRSRLEARWAVFFDAAGVKYEYEPEGFDLGDGLYYLPDFKIKCYGTRGGCGEPPFDLYVEVKGKMTDLDAKKINRFLGGYDEKTYMFENPVLIVGQIPSEKAYLDTWCNSDEIGNYRDMDGCDIYPFNYETIDGDHFAAYPAVKPGMFYLFGDDSNYINKEDIPFTKMCFTKARQARFEHGETPGGGWT